MSTYKICFYGEISKKHMLWVPIRIALASDSNEYPQHMFLWRNKQNYPLIIIKYPLFHWPKTTENNSNSHQEPQQTLRSVTSRLNLPVPHLILKP